jgi:alpha-ketoglutarate-dependent taurine dioxygenase
MNLEMRLLARLSPNEAVFQNRVFFGEDSGNDPIGWMAFQRDAIMKAVMKHGWILIRGLQVSHSTHFHDCIATLGLCLASDYGDLPFTAPDDPAPQVFGVTPFPADHAILFHNEGSHTAQAPRFICFQCDTPAESGGETPLADCGLALEALPDAIAIALSEQGLAYKRIFMDHLDVPWQRYFGTGDRLEVEVRCADEGIEASWDAHGRLRTEIRRPAVIRHPEQGRLVLFNQFLLYHPACLDPEVRAAFEYILPDGETPRSVRLGDGSPIPDEWADRILAAYVRVAGSFAWKPGDLLIVDNFAVAHARRPYSGERRHRVILGLDAQKTRFPRSVSGS